MLAVKLGVVAWFLLSAIIKCEAKYVNQGKECLAKSN